MVLVRNSQNEIKLLNLLNLVNQLYSFMRIILASKSPARKKMLTQMGLKFEVMPSENDEAKITDPLPSRRVKKIALEKALETIGKIRDDQGKQGETIIISADTMVYCNKQFIGKPTDLNDAKRILKLLSGTTHYLYSGICVMTPTHTFLDYDKSEVTFRKLSNEEIDDYIKNNNVLYWAGGYTIEKGTPGASFIKKIKGSNSNVLGLPVKKLLNILKQVIIE